MAQQIPIPIDARTTRERRDMRFDDDKKVKFANRVVDFFNEDLKSRHEENDKREQRHAKLRQWRSRSDWPWPDSSDQAIPLMAIESLRAVDTLVNAALSTRPVVVSKAVAKRDADQQDAIDLNHDTQFFVEQKGESVLQDLAEEFVNEPAAITFTVWVKEKRRHTDRRTFPGLPDDQMPREYFLGLVKQNFSGLVNRALDTEGWDWVVGPEDQQKEVSFYTLKSGAIEMIVKEDVLAFDGPKVIVKDYGDVFYPADVANLQAPSPSNPGGAPHVILLDRPTVQEIQDLQREGFYDQVSKKDLENLADQPVHTDDEKNTVRKQRQIMAGKDAKEDPKDRQHKPLTRLMCFDTLDLGSGRVEDVIFWVLLETKKLLKVKRMTEMYPSRIPRRPLSHSSFLPVAGRVDGISMLELVEGLHDWTKETVDMMMDAGQLANSPIGAYRPQSSIKPENMRMAPGDLIPMNDPGRDLKILTVGNPNQSFSLNVLAMIEQMKGRLTLQGELQSGRVPLGSSSALRNQGSIRMLLAQGEARPERTLRRYFSIILDIHELMHSLNRSFLSTEKQFRVMGPQEEGASPYQKINRDDIQGEYKFDFRANVLNSNKQVFSESLQAFMEMVFSPLGVQTGVATADGFYRAARDRGNALGIDPDNYIERPSPDSNKQRLDASDVFADLVDGDIPNGIPREPAVEHLQNLAEIKERLFKVTGSDGGETQIKGIDLLAHVQPDMVQALALWEERVAERAEREVQQAALMQAAGGGQPGQIGAGPGRPAEQIQGPGGNPQIQGEELLDESLPGAGGAGAVQ